jgi:hypothetical protein
MADNSVRTPGSGETIRTIEKGSGAYKVPSTVLDIGGTDEESLVDQSNPLPVFAPDRGQVAQNLVMTNTANAVTVPALNGVTTVAIQITGTWTGSILFEATVDGTNFFPITMHPIAGFGALITSVTANGQWQGDIAGYAAVRARCSVTGSGTAVVSLRTTGGASDMAVTVCAPGETLSGSVTANNTDLLLLDCAQIRALAIQATALGGGATIAFQTSNDGTTWTAALAYQVGGSSVNSQTSSVGQWILPVTGRYVRIRTTSHSSGTSSVVVFAMQQPPAVPVPNVSVNSLVIGSSASTLGKNEDAVAGSGDTGVFVLGVRRDSPATNVSAAGDYVEFAFNAENRLYTAPGPTTSGGCTIDRTISAATTNPKSVKASAGQVYTIIAVNLNAAVRYLKLYNKASAPTVGTDVPVMTIPIPGNTAGAGIVIDTGAMGAAFATGIALAITTGVADNDTGAVAANEVIVHLLYK